MAQLVMIATTGAFAADATSDAAAVKVDFNRDIRPILRTRCMACHGGVEKAVGLSFMTRESALAETDSGSLVIVPGEPDVSPMMERVSSDDPHFRMPPAEHGPSLTAEEISLLRRWVEQGADWESYWAFTKPRRAKLPAIQNDSWCRSDLDRFVLAKIEQAGLRPSAEAGRPNWLRRVSFDLTGLPPEPALRASFLSDESADAYEKAVEKLLVSPAFGERWASVWLDLARYADTIGYERDPHRNIWPYRDWVIRALNADMPFDEFTIKQLAGDLLPGATIDDRLATAFHRNTQSNDEGGTDDEEFRTAAVLDRVNTTWLAWQGLTFGCAQCHDHPYEPIEHREFYEFAAFFNTSQDADLPEEWPMASIPLNEADRPRAAQFDEEIARSRRQLRETYRSVAAEDSQWKEISFEETTATGREKLRTRTRDGRSEVVTEGTISANTQHTLTGTVPADAGEITALRVDVLPVNPDAAAKIPETGFVLSKLEILVRHSAEADFQAVPLRSVYEDDEHSLMDAQRTLDGDPLGWAAYTTIDRPRHAVFILSNPLKVAPGWQIRVVLKQNMISSGVKGLVIQRARYSVSSDKRWHSLSTAPEREAANAALAKLVEQRRKIKSLDVPVMAEQAAGYRRRTFIFTRGNWLERADEVTPDVPSIFPPLAPDSPRNRLGLAQWLVSDDNPLTARVVVNRLWEQLFGRGLVLTLEDFGSSGTEPSHPELLDHLAIRFQAEYDWSIKRVLRDIVLSSTYRQANVATAEGLEKDPSNILLARGPRMRLSAEMIRDATLATSGLWSQTMFGPPVMPFQPEGVWRSAYSDAKWETSPGNDRHRRAIYTYWKRTSGYPTMLTFDAPSREVCTARRIATNTPLQALATLNDPVFFECAEALAGRMVEVNGGVRAQIAWAYEQATGAAPSQDKVDILVSLYEEARGSSAKADAGAEPDAEERQLFALAVVANAIFNLDEALTK